MIRTMSAVALLLGAAAPASAAPITYDFTAVFTSGPLGSLSGVFTRDGDRLVEFDMTLGGVRFDRAAVDTDSSGFFLSRSERIFGTLDGPGMGISIGTTDFSFVKRITIAIVPGMAETVEYDFDYTLPGLDDLVSADRVTVIERAAAVPEPASWAMMIAGFGLSGFALRRHRFSVRPA